MSDKTYARYVALGDSQTEGLCDGDEVTGYRGWADRLAEKLAAVNPEFRYANLAVRGKLAAEIRAEQLDAALALRPDLATVVAGMNDMLRPKFDADQVAEDIDVMFGKLTAAGAQVVTMTYPQVDRLVPLARGLMPRVHALNERITELAATHGATLLETHPHDVVTDPRLWHSDRLHANSLGHTRIAEAVAHVLGLPGSDDTWSAPLPPVQPPGALRMVGTEARWVATFLGPWISRRVRGVSSGDGRVAKRPDLTPPS